MNRKREAGSSKKKNEQASMIVCMNFPIRIEHRKEKKAYLYKWCFCYLRSSILYLFIYNVIEKGVLNTLLYCCWKIVGKMLY